MSEDTQTQTESAEAVERAESRSQKTFNEVVIPQLGEKFGLTNPMAMPKMEKIVLNVNMGRHLEGTKVPQAKKDTILSTLETITGQKPVVIKAKKSVSNFKVREGYDTSAIVTLRRMQMWYFFDRLVHLAMPRIKDFRGVTRFAFDQRGSYSFGLTEQGVFPEIDMARVNFTHGMNINIVFARSTPEISKFVLTEMKFPFKSEDEDKKKVKLRRGFGGGRKRRR